MASAKRGARNQYRAEEITRQRLGSAAYLAAAAAIEALYLSEAPSAETLAALRDAASHALTAISAWIEGACARSFQAASESKTLEELL